MRSGDFVKQVEGYRAFHPARLPPADPPIQYDTELIRLLTRSGPKPGTAGWRDKRFCRIPICTAAISWKDEQEEERNVAANKWPPRCVGAAI
jgi:hypothetical protein